MFKELNKSGIALSIALLGVGCESAPGPSEAQDVTPMRREVLNEKTLVYSMARNLETADLRVRYSIVKTGSGRAATIDLLRAKSGKCEAFSMMIDWADFSAGHLAEKQGLYLQWNKALFLVPAEWRPLANCPELAFANASLSFETLVPDLGLPTDRIRYLKSETIKSIPLEITWGTDHLAIRLHQGAQSRGVYSFTGKSWDGVWIPRSELWSEEDPAPLTDSVTETVRVTARDFAIKKLSDELDEHLVSWDRERETQEARRAEAEGFSYRFPEDFYSYEYEQAEIQKTLKEWGYLK